MPAAPCVLRQLDEPHDGVAALLDSTRPWRDRYLYVGTRQHVVASALCGLSQWLHALLIATVRMRLSSCAPVVPVKYLAHLSSRCWKQQPAHRESGNVCSCGAWVGQRIVAAGCLREHLPLHVWLQHPFKAAGARHRAPLGCWSSRGFSSLQWQAGWAQHLCLGTLVNHIVGVTYTRAPVDCLVLFGSVRSLTMPKEAGWCLW